MKLLPIFPAAGTDRILSLAKPTIRIHSLYLHSHLDAKGVSDEENRMCTEATKLKYYFLAYKFQIAPSTSGLCLRATNEHIYIAEEVYTIYFSSTHQSAKYI